MDERASGLAPDPRSDRIPLELPDPSLVLLVGVAGCGKSTFAAAHFDRTEVLSSDHLRAIVSGDPDDQTASGDAFAALRFLLDKRMKRGLLTAIDATNLERGHRRQLTSIGRDHDVPAAAIVLDVEPEVCRERNASREGRTVDEEVLADQRRALERTLRQIHDEDLAAVHVLGSADEVERAEIVRVRRRATDPS